MKLFIVIPVINLWSKYTKNCIDCIQSKYLDKVVIINNASTDETSEECRKLDKNKFLVIDNADRQSCAKSWNQGCDFAFGMGADYVAIINNDTLFHPTTFDKLVEFLENHKEYSCVSSWDIGQLWKPSASSVSKEYMDMAVVPIEKFEYKELNYSCFVVSKGCWEKVGRFDEEFKPAYFEDLDYRYRMQLVGEKVCTLESSIFYHYGSKTQKDALGDGKLMCPSPQFEINRGYFKRKWGGSPGQETFKTPFNK
jgi:GT2 family glycosyltransferase